MKKQWQHFWQQMRKEAKTSFLATTILTVAFFLIFFPIIPFTLRAQLDNLIISSAFGYGMFAAIMALYGITYMLAVFMQRKSKQIIKLSSFVNLSIWLLGMGLGSCFGMAVKASIIGVPITMSSMWVSLLFGAAFALMFHFYYSYKKSSLENLNLQIKNSQSELHVLKNQMQPHFLFNSLNSLLHLIESKDEQAPEVTMLLSDLYREILEQSKKTVVTLKRELALVEKYLKIERLRFGKRLKFEFIVPEDSDRIFLPPLILQTLVENAVKHGISHQTETGEIKIIVQKDELGYSVKVINSGVLIRSEKSNGTGLQNSKSRLELLYGSKNSFQISNWNDQVKVSFWISGEPVGSL